MSTAICVVPKCRDITNKLSLSFDLLGSNDQVIMSHWNKSNIGQLLNTDVSLVPDKPHTPTLLFTIRHFLEFCIRRQDPISTIFPNFEYLMNAYLDLIPSAHPAINKTNRSQNNKHFDFQDIMLDQLRGEYRFTLNEEFCTETITFNKLNDPKLRPINLIDVLDLPIYFDKPYHFNTWFDFARMIIQEICLIVDIDFVT